LDSVLAPALVVEPPKELQFRLELMARTAAAELRTAAIAAPVVVRRAWRSTLAAAGIAGVASGLAIWQVAGWVDGAQKLLGDVPRAIEVLVNSPAMTYVSEPSADVQQLAFWAALGLGAWAVSDASPLRRILRGTGADLSA
jgi:hypothetical protein